MTVPFYLFIWFWLSHGIKQSHCFNSRILIKMHCSGVFNLFDEYFLLSLQDLILSKISYSYCILKNPSFIHRFFFLFPWTTQIDCDQHSACFLANNCIFPRHRKVCRGRKRQKNTHWREVVINMGTTTLQSVTALSHALMYTT